MAENHEASSDVLVAFPDKVQKTMPGPGRWVE
jgi:hypothetical protein